MIGKPSKQKLNPNSKKQLSIFDIRSLLMYVFTKTKPEKDLQETFPFLATTAAADKVSNGNPKLRAEQNCEAISGAIAANPAFYVACGFTAPQWDNRNLTDELKDDD